MEPVTPVPESQSRKVAEPGTEYVVFKEQDDGSFVRVGKTTTGRTPEAAIKAVVEAEPEDKQAGMYVAVAKSRWQLVEIEPHVERTLIVRPI